MSHFSDYTRPIGYAVPPAERPGRGPHHKGKDSDKGNFKSKDKSLPDWPPLIHGPIKVSPKVSLRAFRRDCPRVLTKASLGVKGFLLHPFSPPLPIPPLRAHLKLELSSNPCKFHAFTNVIFSPFFGLLSAWAYCPARSTAPLPFDLSLCYLVPRCLFVCGSRNSRWFLSVLYLDLLPWGPSLGILSGSSLFSLSSYYLFLLCFPLLFPFLSSSPLLSFSLAFLFERCLPKVALPNVATP